MGEEDMNNKVKRATTMGDKDGGMSTMPPPSTLGNHDEQDKELLLSRPTVMFVWDFDDIKRLMDVDPRIKQSMSVMLGFDISHKHKISKNLGSRFCGITTQAATDGGISRPLCGSGEEVTKLRFLAEGDVTD